MGVIYVPGNIKTGTSISGPGRWSARSVGLGVAILSARSPSVSIVGNYGVRILSRHTCPQPTTWTLAFRLRVVIGACCWYQCINDTQQQFREIPSISPPGLVWDRTEYQVDHARNSKSRLTRRWFAWTLGLLRSPHRCRRHGTTVPARDSWI